MVRYKYINKIIITKIFIVVWGQVRCRYDRMASALIRLFTRAGSEPIDIRVRFCERCMTFKIMCLFIQMYSVLMYLTVTVSSIMSISPVKSITHN